MSIAARRDEAIGEALGKVRAIEAERGATREALDEIREIMIGLAGRAELFPEEDFPIPEGAGETFDRLSIDDDGRFELYIEIADRHVTTPPHNHTTWAVVVGIRGLELNRLYEGVGGPMGEAPPRVAREVEVKRGTGVCLMPDDYHSIHMEAGVLNMHLHLYGLGFVHLRGRKMYDEASGAYRDFDRAMDG